MMVYSAMVDRIDQNIGRVMAKLEQKGVADDTLIIFLSDNGANKLEYGNPEKDMPGPPGTGHALGRPWAHASNSPYSGYKSSNYEGGGRTPAIFCWPNQIEAGTVDHGLAHVTDITATCLDLAGLPHDRILGQSLTRGLCGGERDTYRELGFGFRGAHAYREGKWKLVRYGGPWQLYDMEADPTEIHDLVNRRPDVATRLQEKWLEWNSQVVYRGQDEELKPVDEPMEWTLVELNL
jgi:arylsulfatase